MKIFLPTLWSFQLYSFIKSFPHLILFLYVKSDWKIMHSPTILNQKIKRFFQNLEFWSLVSTEFEFPGKPKISIPKKNHKSFWSDICRYLIFFSKKTQRVRYQYHEFTRRLLQIVHHTFQSRLSFRSSDSWVWYSATFTEQIKSEKKCNVAIIGIIMF